MSSINITIDGYNELMQKLGSKLPAILTRGVMQGINNAVVLVEGKATMLAPVDTGDLRKKMGSEQAMEQNGAIIGKVYNTSDHAMYVEFGTGRRGNGTYTYPTDVVLEYDPDWAGQVAQPYLGRALHTSQSQVKSAITQSITNAMKGL